MVAFDKILVPHDGTKSSDRALEYAVKVAGDNANCEIILMHVVLSIPLPSPSSKRARISTGSRSYLHDVYEELESNAERILLELKRGWTRDNNLIMSTHVVIGGNVAQRIVDYAKNHAVDLIVINSRSTLGRGGSRLKFWVPIGSVSRVVSEIAPCPVLLVRPVE